MKNILIPTDLTVQSLWPIHKLMENANGEKMNIYLVHMLYIPTDWSELLGIRNTNPNALAPANFIEAYQILRNKNKDLINKLNLEFIYGSSKRILYNYMEGKKIDNVFLLNNYDYNFHLEQSIDFISYFKYSKVPVIELPFYIDNNADYQTLSILLKGNTKVKEIISADRRPAFFK